MYTVLGGEFGEFVREFETFEEAEAFIEAHEDGADMWVVEDEYGYEPDYSEVDFDPYAGCYMYNDYCCYEY